MDITHAYLQLTSVTQSYPIVWDHTDCSTSGSPVLHHLLELAQTHIHQLADAIQPSNPLPSPSLPAINISQHQGLFQWVNSFHSWSKYWSFSISISTFNEYSGLISFSMDQFDLVAVQGTLKSLLQYRSSKVSVPGVSVSLWSSSHIHTDYWENHNFD